MGILVLDLGLQLGLVLNHGLARVLGELSDLSPRPQSSWTLRGALILIESFGEIKYLRPPLLGTISVLEPFGGLEPNKER